MSAPSTTQPAHSFTKFQEDASRLFEAQLESIGLGRAQIAQQSIAELDDSLVRVDDALRTPESFGVLRLSMTASAAVLLVKSDSGSHIEVGVVPLLLERKKAIIRHYHDLIWC